MQVPIYNPQANISGGLIGGGASVPLSGRVNPGLGQGTLGTAGRELEKIGEQITAARDQAVLTSNTIGLQKDISDLKLSYEQRNDYTDFIPSYKKDVEALRDKYAELSPSNRVSDAFKPIFQKVTAHGAMALNNVIRKKEIEHSKGLYIEDRNNLMALSARSPDEEGVSEYIQKNADILKSNIATGLINSQDAVVNGLSFKNEAWTNFTNQLIHDDPKKALSLLEKENKLPGLQEKTRNMLLAKAQAAVKDNLTTSAYQKISDKFQGNPLKASQYISDPKNIKRMGLDLRQAAFVKTVFDGEYNQQREVAAREQAASREAWSDKINKSIMGNDLITAARLIGESSLDGETKRRMFDGIKKREFKTNPRVVVGLYGKIDSGQIKEPYQIDRELGHGLGQQDVVKLRTYLQKSKNEDKHNYFNDVRYSIRTESQLHSKRKQLIKLQPEFELLVRQEAERQGINKYDPKILDIATQLLQYHDSWTNYFYGQGEYQFQEDLKKQPKSPEAPPDAIKELLSDPSPEAQAEFKKVFGYIPEGVNAK